MKFIPTFLFFIFCIVYKCPAQIAGTGLLDGLYIFKIELNEGEDGLWDGFINYDHIDKEYILVGTSKGDTLICQEIDEYLNAKASLLLIRSGDIFYGEWHDTEMGYSLPLLFYTNKKNATLDYVATRYEIDWSNNADQFLYSIPLSPTVDLGKYISISNNTVFDYTSTSLFESVQYYTKNGKKEFELTGRVVESVDVDQYHFIDPRYTLEGHIPDFGEIFLDSMTSAINNWNNTLSRNNHRRSDGFRFPPRYYAICDIDFWTSDWISGSFEYVTPLGQGQGFTFIFDRKNQEFIPFQDIIRAGDWTSVQKELKSEHLGISFDVYGLIYKGRFNAVESRKSLHISWDELDIRVKRKISGSIK